ncbi:MAG: N-6 DNA methylase [Clostridia bacterium]|nr:N-6 DNA methylase [Clostridia bacterium]
MNVIISKIQDELKVKGYTQISDIWSQEDGSSMFIASGDNKSVYIKVYDSKTELSPLLQEASLFEAQDYDVFPDFVWATNGESNYYADCAESESLASIPRALEVAVREKKELSKQESWSRSMYQKLQQRFDNLHERLYGPSSKDNISSTNDAINELSKFIFMETFRLNHPEYKLEGDCEGLRLYDILDFHYIANHGKKAVEQIRSAFKQIKNHPDYVATTDDGQPCFIFSEDEYLRLENPVNYVAAFTALQDLDEYEDNNGIRKQATLNDLTADVLGRLFDVLLRGKYDNKVGQATYLTPRPVTEAMAAMVMYDITSDPQQAADLISLNEKDMPNFRMLDATSGSGGFIIKFYEEVKRYINRSYTGHLQSDIMSRFELMKEHSFVGADSSRDMILKARINMAMHGMPKAPIFWVDNSLTSPQLQAGHYDVILTNPPFGAGSVNNKDKEGKAILDDYCTGIIDGRPGKEGLCLGAKPDSKGKWKQVNSTDQAVLFIDRNLQLLKPGGYLMIVLPDGILSNSGYQFVREYLMGKKNEVSGAFEGGRAIVKAVVSLPNVTFQLSGTGAKTSFLYLQKKKDPSQKQGPIFMAVADEIGFDVKNKVEVNLGNDRNDLLKIVEAYKKGA